MHFTFEELTALLMDIIPGVAVLAILLAIFFGGGMKELFEIYVLWLYG